MQLLSAANELIEPIWAVTEDQCSAAAFFAAGTRSPRSRLKRSPRKTAPKGKEIQHYLCAEKSSPTKLCRQIAVYH